MKPTPLALLVLLCTVIGLGCHTSLPDGVMCETPAGVVPHTCTTYLVPQDEGFPACGGGTTKVDVCPTTHGLGTCHTTSTLSGEEQDIYTTFYSDDGETAAQAEATCATFEGSTWAPG